MRDQQNILYFTALNKSKLYLTLRSPWVKERDVEEEFTYLYNLCQNVNATKDRINGKFISDGVIKVFKDSNKTQLKYWILQECKLSTYKEDKYHIAAQFLQALVYISFSLYDISIDLPGDLCKGIILNSKYYFGYISRDDIDLASWEPLWDKYRKIVRPCDAYKYPELINWALSHIKFTQYFDLDNYKDKEDLSDNGILTYINKIINETE